MDFAHLWALTGRGVFWVMRAKDNLAVQVKKRLPKHADKRILKDELLVLKVAKTAQDYPEVMRRVTALVEVDGFTRLFTFVRAALWLPRVLTELLHRCGTADGNCRDLGRPEPAWLPGLARPLMGQQA